VGAECGGSGLGNSQFRIAMDLALSAAARVRRIRALVPLRSSGGVSRSSVITASVCEYVWYLCGGRRGM
jgi:hypothetical protein